MAGDAEILAGEGCAVRAALGAWALDDPATRCTPITVGHINRTFVVDVAGQARYVLQRLNPIFGPEVDEDIAALTAQLARAGLLTPRLVPTRDGALHHREGGAEAGVVWRLLTHVEGATFEQVDSPARCREAGALLGRFHRALWDLEHRFRHRRLGVHDTARHLQHLRQVLAGYGDHRLYPVVSAEGQAILAAAAAVDVQRFATLPERIVHGDPKISNVIFAADGSARCLIDLDTVARMPLAVELGDALRSWCSPLGEERCGPFSLELYRAGLGGWAATVGELPTPAERQAIAAAVELIALELAARFCSDALEERYFGWDAQRYGSAAEHNLARCRAQLHLARQVRAQLPALEASAAALW